MKQLKLILLPLLAFGLYITSLYLFEIFGNFKSDISWGISIYYSKYIYFMIVILSFLSWKLKNRKWSYITILIMFFVFCFYWKDSFYVYPNRVLVLLLISLVIYFTLHFISYKNLIDKW